MKKVSIIMPCYNDGAYMGETFASIAAQTYPDIEVIVVDDGSTDAKTLEVIAALEKDGRAKVLRQHQQGPSAARNMAIRAAAGEYLLPLDADDIIDAEYIAKAAAVLDAHPKTAAVYCHGEYFGEVTGPMKLKDYSLREMLVDNVVFITALIRRTAVEEAGLFDESFKSGLEDYDLFLSILEKGWEIEQLPETYFHYRVKPVSRTTRMTDDHSRYIDTYRKLFGKHTALYAAHMNDLIPDLKEAFVKERGRVYEKECEIIAMQDRINHYDSIPFLAKRLVKRVFEKLRGK